MLSRIPTLLNRITSFRAHPSTSYFMNQSIQRVDSTQSSLSSPFWTQFRGFKDKDVLKLRCPDCYFERVDNRWWVLCRTHPRHKQREKVEDIRKNWIVTHITRTGRPFRKHFQYPGHDL